MIIENLFHVKKGQGEYREKLSTGSTPLISAKNSSLFAICYSDDSCSAGSTVGLGAGSSISVMSCKSDKSIMTPPDSPDI